MINGISAATGRNNTQALYNGRFEGRKLFVALGIVAVSAVGFRMKLSKDKTRVNKGIIHDI